MTTTTTKPVRSGTEKYIEAVGRRKEAIARVRITPSSRTSFVVNEKKLDEYFVLPRLQKSAQEALEKSGGQKFSVSVKVSGGGKTAQAEAIRLGIARALVKNDENLRVDLKKEGWLMRDPRVKERKKFGLRKARRAPQWSKR